jgi:hypothetical protein
MGLLDLPPLVTIRRNHAIEHATIHILSRMRPDTNMAGRANSRGFVIYGDLSTEAVGQAVHEAIRRIRNGEAYLAVHPNCGTNMVTTAVLTTITVLLAGMGRHRHWLERISTALTAAVGAVLLSQFLGTALQQQVTTCAQLEAVDVVEVRRQQFGRRVLHWVHLRHSPAPSSA